MKESCHKIVVQISFLKNIITESPKLKNPIRNYLKFYLTTNYLFSRKNNKLFKILENQLQNINKFKNLLTNFFSSRTYLEDLHTVLDPYFSNLLIWSPILFYF